MANEATDAIAQHAARMLAAGQAASIREAVKTAAAALAVYSAPLPSDQLVRDHLRAMSMQALGVEGYNQRVSRTLQTAEQIMTLLEVNWPDCRTLLVGRAAAGNIDAGVRLQIRVHTDRPVSEFAALLVEAGFDEPAFSTAQTKSGRFSRVIVEVDEDIVILTRIPTSVHVDDDRDLFTNRPVKVANIQQVRQMLRRLGPDELSDPM